MNFKPKIEYILLASSVFCFFSAVILQTVESRNFSRALSCVEQNIELGGVQNNSKIQNGISESDEFEPFLIFNKNLCKVKNAESIKLSLYEIQNKIQKIFNYFFSISFFLIVLAIFLSFQKSARKKNHLEMQNAIKDAHLDFSREVHDGLAQDLAALKFTLKSGELEKANHFAEQAFNESRYLIEETRINLSDDFIQNIKEMLSSFEANFAIHTDFLCASRKIQKIPQKHKQSLLKILNESLSNVARHSKATKVKVKIVDLSDGFRFIVSDNGGGKDCRNMPDNDSKPNIERKHFGLENIKERAERMNGEAQINFSNEDGGTTVAVTIKDSVR